MPNYNSLQHIFLIAMPQMEDTRFTQAVIYLWEYNEQGATGFVINKPLEISLGEMLVHLEIPVVNQEVEKQPIMHGGPVASDRGFIIHRKYIQEQDSGKQSVNVTISSTRQDLIDLAEGNGLGNTLVILGYATWAAGQLDRELAMNSWLVTPFNDSVLFDQFREDPLDEETSHGAKQWRQAAAKGGIDLNRLSLEAGHA